MLTPGSHRLVRRAAAALTVAFAIMLPLTAAGPASADQARQRQQWVLNALDVPAAWHTTQGQGVTVGVIDSGVDPNVSDLTGQVKTGPDYTGVHTPKSNPNWGAHGTWMASLIAGHGNGPGGKDGIIGVAPKSRILSVRVITDQNDPNHAAYLAEPGWKGQKELAEAIRYAVGHHVGVISMSLGYSAPSIAVRSALQYALHRNVVVVASSGNSGATHSAHQHGAPYSFPADYPGVLGVAAVNEAGHAAYFSSSNLSVEVAAPGVRVPAQGRGSKFWVVSGTSPACALTAGVAALVKSKYPKLTATQVREAIIKSSAHRPKSGYDDKVGFGTVDAAAALRAASKMSGQVPAGNTEAGRRAAEGNFGGGQSAVPAFPVPPQGKNRLLILLGVAAVSLLVLILALWRLVWRIRRRARAKRAALARAARLAQAAKSAGAVTRPAAAGASPAAGGGASPEANTGAISGTAAPDVRYPTQIFPAEPFRQGRPAPGTVGQPVQGYQAPGDAGQDATAPAAGYPGPGYAAGGWPGGAWPGAEQPGGAWPGGNWSGVGSSLLQGGQADAGQQPQLPPGQSPPGQADQDPAAPALVPGQVGPPDTPDDDDWAFEQDDSAGTPAQGASAAAAQAAAAGQAPVADQAPVAGQAPASVQGAPPAWSQNAPPTQTPPAPQTPPPSPASPAPQAPVTPQGDMDRWLADPLTSPRIPDAVRSRDSWSAGQFSDRLSRRDATRRLRSPGGRFDQPAEPAAAAVPAVEQDKDVPPTAVPSTVVPSTAVPSTSVPPTAVPSTPAPAADARDQFGPDEILEVADPGPAGLPRRTPGAQTIGPPGRSASGPAAEDDLASAGPVPAERQAGQSVWEPLNRPAAGLAGGDWPAEPSGGSPTLQTPESGGAASAAAAADAAGRLADAEVWGRRAGNGGAQGVTAEGSTPPLGIPAENAGMQSPQASDPGAGPLPRRQPFAERNPLPPRHPSVTGQSVPDGPATTSGQSLWDRPPPSARSSLWDEPAPEGAVPQQPGTPSRTTRFDRVAMAGEGSAAAARSSLWDRATPHPSVGPGSQGGPAVAPAAPPQAAFASPAIDVPAARGPAADAASAYATSGEATSAEATSAGATVGSGPQALPRRTPQAHLAAPLRRRPGGSRTQPGASAAVPSVWDVRRPAPAAGTAGQEGAGAPDGSDGRDAGD